MKMKVINCVKSVSTIPTTDSTSHAQGSSEGEDHALCEISCHTVDNSNDAEPNVSVSNEKEAANLSKTSLHTVDNQSSGTLHDILSSVSEDCNQYESSVHTEDSCSNECDLSKPKIESWTHYDEEFNSIINQLNEDLRVLFTVILFGRNMLCSNM